MGVYIEGTNKPETDGTMYQISYFTRDGYFITESYPIYRVIDLDLVRCGECKWWNSGFCNNGRADANLKLEGNCFCDEGERRVDGDI